MDKPVDRNQNPTPPSRLACDFALAPPLVARRSMLRWLAASGAAVAAAALGAPPAKAASAPLISSCSASARETAGFFPADGSGGAFPDHRNVLLDSAVVRSDIRASFGASTRLALGIPLQLSFHLRDGQRDCEPISQGAVYLWSCDRNGEYSLYAPGLERENYLRGVQFADAAGTVQFQTIFPACYAGRYPHLHAEIFAGSGTNLSQLRRVLITQFAMPVRACAEVYSHAEGYERSNVHLRETSLSSDIVFSSSSPSQLDAQTLNLSGNARQGFHGVANIIA